MICKKCGSENVKVQVINEVILKNKNHGVIWWLLWGWYWVPLKWLFFTYIALLVKIFGHKKQKTVNKKVTMFACQNCGNTWKE